jgi:ferric-dicitrate binding protein FerR (iron transport regulator)
MANNQNKMSVYEVLTDEMFVKFLQNTNFENKSYFDKLISQRRLDNDVFESALSIAQEWIAQSESPVGISSERGFLDLQKRASSQRKLSVRWKYAIGLAASLSLIVIFALTDFSKNHIQHPTLISLETGFGETKQYHLKDNSEIKLFPNSRIQLDTTNEVTTRKIYLETGKVYLHIEKKIESSDFQVSLNRMKVTVWGTQFLVESTIDLESVVLREGVVEVSSKNGGMRRSLSPGQSAKLESCANDFVINDINILREFAWLDGNIYLADDSLDEVAGLIKKYYDINVIFESQKLREKTLTGEFPIDDINLLINILETTLNVTIEYKGNQIIINH